MEYRQLGRDGPTIPVIGFGAWPIGGGMGAIPKAEAIATIHAAIDNGITLIDTAQAYRTSEAVIGEALASRDRDDVFIASKVSGDYSRDHVVRAAEQSLRALRTDVIDLYQVHSWNAEYPIEKTMTAMDALRREGKVRYVGVSNFNVDQMRQALAICPIQSLQPRYSLLDRHIEDDILPFCEREGIGILPHSPLAKGLLTGKYRPGHRFPDGDERAGREVFDDENLERLAPKLDALTAIARARGKSLVQLSVNALLRQPAVACVLVGGKNPSQVAEHVGAQGWGLKDEEWSEVERILK
ncbi:aldo/keto reductase [Candidatus Poribacteria bacterium]|jgi:aryl-alcohol dehydrogenase-like predicted oxidoreductase|nr:aldo/keto reductase [Candidatus Poribacteria bacterium]MBT5536351.1 aldo/keto reductase [Candidatus Poribacteria bacterium]MBT5712116.1 aldo/keto reductase [Candidatus Poribacteria bacterium]MBT7098351.1 aldo/keto reductase [Candidatus Poribacteria bacterium]MBT7808521.1 aldo/keto reductase [Candidatus Poribacteria bacterium]